MKKSGKQDFILAALTQESNLIWLIRHLSETSGVTLKLLASREDLLHQLSPDTPSVLVIDFDAIASMDVRQFASEIRQRFPESAILALTSQSSLMDVLCDQNIEHVFLKPYLMEHVYDGIVHALKSETPVGSKSKSVGVKQSGKRPSAKVLIVDDEPEVCEFVRDLLEDSLEGDFEVAMATDPDAAVKLSHEFEPEIVIADLKLPQMSGLELIERLKRGGGAKPKDFLIFTGSNSPARKEELEQLGFTVLTKPCDGANLISAITQICHKWNLVA